MMQFIIAMSFGLKIETEAGYYECPHCGKKGWHKKVLTKEK